ncbi:MAG: hypothetical protein EOM66_09570, partial [Clostridia bacterium]|nr:hypothetical protein [Clostridia bacterium]
MDFDAMFSVNVKAPFKIIQAALLYRNMPIEIADEWLDLVAVGTVSDLVPLTGENRIIAALGLEKLNKFERLGIKLLARSVRLDKLSAR